MIRSIWNSRSGMSAQMEKMDVISNNIANINTAGYKRKEVNFSNLMQETLKRRGYPVDGNKQENAVFTGTGVRVSEVQMDNSQGSLLQTDKNTDLAIDGVGMFKVIDPNGNEAYTRAGTFKIDKNGTIVDSNGNRLVILDQNGINVNNQNGNFVEKDFIVDNKGNLISDRYNGLRIPIYKTIGSNSMKSIGNNLYVPEVTVDGNGLEQQARVIESGDADILQGFVENSNVDLGKEMADMIITQRAFQLNSSALKTADEMWQMANNLRSR